MSAQVHIGRYLTWPVVLFADRTEAGRALADWINPEPDPAAIVFALPRGGIPVGRVLADRLGCELRPALVRKLPIPANDQMGFGAVTVDGTVRLNGAVVDAFDISEQEVSAVVEEVRAEVERRGAAYPGGWPLPRLTGRHVWLVDDGLATGFSMLAAADMLLARMPASLSIAVPCSPADTVPVAATNAYAVWCFATQEGRPFAVASFYLDFHDLEDVEVREALVR